MLIRFSFKPAFDGFNRDGKEGMVKDRFEGFNSSCVESTFESCSQGRISFDFVMQSRF